MSFIEEQQNIVRLCAYETASLIAPSVIITLTVSSEKNKESFIKNSLLTLQASASYFVGCIARCSLSSLKNKNPTPLEDLEFTVGPGVAAGLVSYSIGYTLDSKPSFSIAYLAASIFSSTGYSLSFQYIPRPYLTSAIFAMEIVTEMIPGGLISTTTAQSFTTPKGLTKEALKMGAISGIAFAAIDLLESSITSQGTPQPNENITLSSEICSVSNILPLDIAKVEICEIE